MAPESGEVHFRAAGTLEQLGDRAGALRELARARELHYSWEEVQRDPGLTALRDDARFKRIETSPTN